jgi:hypothetical protein
MGGLMFDTFIQMMIFGFRVVWILITLIYKLVRFITIKVVEFSQTRDPQLSAGTVVRNSTLGWGLFGLLLMLIFLVGGVADGRLLFFPVGLATAGYLASTWLTKWWTSPDLLQPPDDNMGMPRDALEAAEEEPFLEDRQDGVILGEDVTHKR